VSKTKNNKLAAALIDAVNAEIERAGVSGSYGIPNVGGNSDNMGTVSRKVKRAIERALKISAAEAYAEGKAYGEHTAAPTSGYVEVEEQLSEALTKLIDLDNTRVDLEHRLGQAQQALAYWLKETEWVQERGGELGCRPGEHRIDFMNGLIRSLQTKYDTLRETSQKMSQHETMRTKEIQDRDRKIQALELDLKIARGQRDTVNDTLARVREADAKAREHNNEAARRFGLEPMPEGDIPLIDALIRGARLECAPITAVRQELIGRLTERRGAIENTVPALVDQSTQLTEWRLVGEVLLKADVDTPEYDLAITMCDKLLNEGF
jgi:hypothetical protein